MSIQKYRGKWFLKKVWVIYSIMWRPSCSLDFIWLISSLLSLIMMAVSYFYFPSPCSKENMFLNVHWCWTVLLQRMKMMMLEKGDTSINLFLNVHWCWAVLLQRMNWCLVAIKYWHGVNIDPPTDINACNNLLICLIPSP